MKQSVSASDPRQGAHQSWRACATLPPPIQHVSTGRAAAHIDGANISWVGRGQGRTRPEAATELMSAGGQGVIATFKTPSRWFANSS
jgi:hypothetical protein